MKILIVGSGLAGISLSHHLLQAGADVHVMSASSIPSSTEVATGMYNPVVFRRLNLSWRIEELLPVMHAFIDDMEALLQVDLRSPISFVKRIPSLDYAHLWDTRRTVPPHHRFMGPQTDGFGEVLEAGIIDCTQLKIEYERYLKEQGRLVDDTFDAGKLIIQQDGVAYDSEGYDQVCFCEGPHALKNPLFNWLPFNPCQGEWMVIETEEALTDKVINNKVNIIPVGQHRYKLSSTYSWKTLDWEPHEDAARELLQAFEEVFDVRYKVVTQRAGVRPTVADRRPYLGRHPKHDSLLIFNGLGSKGVMLAPFFARQLTAHILHNAALDAEVDISRHRKRFEAQTTG